MDSLEKEARVGIPAMLNQMLIVLVSRLGGTVEVPVSEIDGTGDRVLIMEMDNDKRTFRFHVEHKQ